MNSNFSFTVIFSLIISFSHLHSQNDTIFYDINEYDKYFKPYINENQEILNEIGKDNALGFKKGEPLPFLIGYYSSWITANSMLLNSYNEGLNDRREFICSQQNSINLLKNNFWVNLITDEEEERLSKLFDKYFDIMSNHRRFTRRQNRKLVRRNKQKIENFHNDLSDIIDNVSDVYGEYNVNTTSFFYTHFAIALEYDIFRIEKSINEMQSNLVKKRLLWNQKIKEQGGGVIPFFKEISYARQEKLKILNNTYATENSCARSGGHRGTVYYFKVKTEKSNRTPDKPYFYFLDLGYDSEAEEISQEVGKVEIVGWNGENCCKRGPGRNAEIICFSGPWNSPSGLTRARAAAYKGETYEQIAYKWTELDKYLGTYLIFKIAHLNQEELFNNLLN